MPRHIDSRRDPSASEELANCASHAVAFVLAVAGLPWLVLESIERHGTIEHEMAVTIFALTMMALYLASALHHGLPHGHAKVLFEQIDRASIYLFIAASYTPFAVSGLDGPRAWLPLALVWTLALGGVVSTCLEGHRRSGLSTGLYVVLGWVTLLAAMAIEGVSPVGGVLLAAGGLAYTAGAGWFLWSGRWRYGHLGWHLLVMTGSSLHFAAVLAHS